MYHITHYLKIPLNEDISLRRFFHFQARPEYEGKWFLKNHATKQYAEVSLEAARLIAAAHNLTLADHIEILGRQTPNGYRKVYIDKSNFATVEWDNDQSTSIQRS